VPKKSPDTFSRPEQQCDAGGEADTGGEVTPQLIAAPATIRANIGHQDLLCPTWPTLQDDSVSVDLSRDARVGGYQKRPAQFHGAKRGAGQL